MLSNKLNGTAARLDDGTRTGPEFKILKGKTTQRVGEGGVNEVCATTVTVAELFYNPVVYQCLAVWKTANHIWQSIY